MVAVRKKAPEAPRKKRSDAKAFTLKLVGLRLRPDQVVALRKAALERATQSGKDVVDKSAIVREVLDEWISRSRR